MFINRSDEIKYLDSLYKEDKAHMIVIYGRRRIGKTALVKEFLKGRRGIYFYAIRQDLKIEAERLAEAVSNFLNRYVRPDFSEVFKAVASEERIILIIDEFTYWIEEDPRILTILQRVWDEVLCKSRIFLILVASLITLVRKSISYGGALYGRRTGQWRVDELEPRYVREFLPNYSLEDLVRVYGAVGGVPYYLSLFNEDKCFEENINRLFFSKGGILYEEAENLLRYEVRNPYIYLNIARAIEEGATTFSEISSKARVNITNLPKYLNMLEKMGVMERVKPIMGRAKPLYVVRDNYIRFWVRYIYPNKNLIELGVYEFRGMNNYIPKVFEEMVRRSLPYLKAKNIIPFLGICGRYWEKDVEVDIVCTYQNRILAIEVKWLDLTAMEANEIIEQLKKKLNYREGFYGVAAKSIDGDVKGIKIELKDLF